MALILVMVVAGLMHGAVAFGFNILAWHNGWEYLVPAIPDGVSVAIAFRTSCTVLEGQRTGPLLTAGVGRSGRLSVDQLLRSVTTRALPQQLLVVLLTVFRKARGREQDEVDRAVAAQRICQDHHEAASHIYDREG